MDTYQDPVFIMEKTKGDTVETPIWDTYEEIVAKHTQTKIKRIERFDFYERSKKAYAILQTGETALYGCIIIKKGVIA